MNTPTINTSYLAFLMVKRHYKSEIDLILDIERATILGKKYLKIISDWIAKNPSRTKKILNNSLNRTCKYYYQKRRRKNITPNIDYIRVNNSLSEHRQNYKAEKILSQI